MRLLNPQNSHTSNSIGANLAADTPSAILPVGRYFPGLKTAARWGGVSILAVFVTLGLGVTMTALIAAEFIAQDKLKAANFDINSVPDDIVVQPSRRDIDPFKKVETPPAPPIISDAKTERVEVPPFSIEGQNDVFKPTKMVFERLGSIAVDQDYQSTVRIEPKMPSRATRSGHCQMVFDVSASGQTYSIKAASCSQSLFEGASRKAVAQWHYNPKIKNGQAMATTGVRTRLTFNLSDEKGRPIPE